MRAAPMIAGTAAEELDRYLEQAAAGGRGTVGGRLPAAGAVRRSGQRPASAGWTNAPARPDHSAAQMSGAPLGVAGPHQKCFLEGPNHFNPPSPRSAAPPQASFSYVVFQVDLEQRPSSSSHMKCRH